jgi:hypothetical protein
MTLYDLFGFSEEERKQLNTTKKGKKKTPPSQAKPLQLNLFSQPVQNTVKNTGSPIIPPNPTPVPKPPTLPAPRPYSGVLQEHHKQGSLVTEQNGQVGFLKERYRNDALFKSLELNPLQTQKAKLYIQLRDAYHTLYNYEATELKENSELRKNLNKHYDTFTSRYGNLNDRKNLDLIRMDAGGTEILSLEHAVNGKLEKADIFNHP